MVKGKQSARPPSCLPSFRCAWQTSRRCCLASAAPSSLARSLNQHCLCLDCTPSHARPSSTTDDLHPPCCLPPSRLRNFIHRRAVKTSTPDALARPLLSLGPLPSASRQRHNLARHSSSLRLPASISGRPTPLPPAQQKPCRPWSSERDLKTRNYCLDTRHWQHTAIVVHRHTNRVCAAPSSLCAHPLHVRYVALMIFSSLASGTAAAA